MRSDCDACGHDHIQECDCGHTDRYMALRRAVGSHEGLMALAEAVARRQRGQPFHLLVTQARAAIAQARGKA